MTLNLDVIRARLSYLATLTIADALREHGQEHRRNAIRMEGEARALRESSGL